MNAGSTPVTVTSCLVKASDETPAGAVLPQPLLGPRAARLPASGVGVVAPSGSRGGLESPAVPRFAAPAVFGVLRPPDAPLAPVLPPLAVEPPVADVLAPPLLAPAPLMPASFASGLPEPLQPAPAIAAAIALPRNHGCL